MTAPSNSADSSFLGITLKCISSLVLVLGLGSSGHARPESPGDPWSRLNGDLRTLYTTLVASPERQAQDVFLEDFNSLKANDAFHCKFPYRYSLFKQAGIISSPEATQREAQLKCSNRIVPLHSSDLGVTGTPLSFVNLDPSRVKRIIIGKNKNGATHFGHSYITVEVCQNSSQNPTCMRPLEVSFHPGAEGNGKWVLAARTLSDMLAATPGKKELTIEEVVLGPPSDRLNDPKWNQYKVDFINALYERMVNTSSAHPLFNSSCSTNVDDLLQLASRIPRLRTVASTPDGVLDGAAQQSGNPRERVVPYETQGNKIVSDFFTSRKITQRNFREYAQIRPADRYCWPENENGVIKAAKASADLAETHPPAPTPVATSKAPCSAIHEAKCDRSRKYTVAVLNLLQKCELLENLLLFDRRADINRRARAGEVVIRSADLQEKLILQLLQKVSEGSQMLGLALETPTRRDLVLKRLAADGGAKSIALGNEILRLVERIEKTRKETLDAHASYLSEKSGFVPPFSLFKRYEEILKKSSLVSSCKTSSCPPSTP